MKKSAHAHSALIKSRQFRARIARKECGHFNEAGRNSTRREFYGNFYHTQCGNLVFYGHSGDFCHTCLCFYYACGDKRHTEYGNNSHTIDFYTVL